MPVAISFSDPVNSAAQFIDGATTGGVASSAMFEATDASHSAVPPTSKDRKSSDEDFDAVLALLLNGGVPPLQVLAVPVKVETNAAESGISDATASLSVTDSNTVGDSSFVTGGQSLLQGRDSAKQQSSASLISMNVATALSENGANSGIAESSAASNLSGTKTTATTSTSIVETAAKTLTGQGVGSSPFTEGVSAMPIISDGQSVDASSKSINISVVSQSSESVAADPLSQEIVQALERIGRPSVSGVDSDPESPSPVTPAQSQTSILTESDLLKVEPQSVVDSIPALKTNLVALPAAATTTSLESKEGAIDPQFTETSESKAVVFSQENSSPSAATLLRSSSSESRKVETGVTTTTTSKSPKSATDIEASATDPRSIAFDQLQRSPGSTKPEVLSDTDSLVSDRSKFRMSSASDSTTATMQSSLISSASPNTVPDLATSISAEMRQPLTSQVSQAIMDHVERNGVRQNDSLSVRLDPPELGEMTIELSKTLEGLAVRVTAREAVTMDMLFARGQEIESQLRGQHMNLKSLEFQRTDMFSSGFSQGQGQSQQQSNASRRSENLLNQIRSGARGLSPVDTSVRSATPDSSYGLSFRA